MYKKVLIAALLISMCVSPAVTSEAEVAEQNVYSSASVLTEEQTEEDEGNQKSEETENVDVDKQYIAEFEITAYCSCSYCCGPDASGITATGTYATAGRTIGVDPDVIPLGSTVYIEGLGEYVAEDTGSAINGYIIDLYMDSHSDALEFGRQHRDVYIMK